MIFVNLQISPDNPGTVKNVIFDRPRSDHFVGNLCTIFQQFSNK